MTRGDGASLGTARRVHENVRCKCLQTNKLDGRPVVDSVMPKGVEHGTATRQIGIYEINA